MALWVWGVLVAVGAISGIVGRTLYSRKSPFGLLGNIVFGIIGGVIAGYCIATGADSSLEALIKTLLAAAAGAFFTVFIMKFITNP